MQTTMHRLTSWLAMLLPLLLLLLAAAAVVSARLQPPQGPLHGPRDSDAMVAAILERSLPPGGLVLLCEEGPGQGAEAEGVHLQGRWPLLTLRAVPGTPTAGLAVRPSQARTTPPGHCCRRPLAGRAAAVILRGSFSYVAEALHGLRSECAGLWNSSGPLLVILTPGNAEDVGYPAGLWPFARVEHLGENWL